MLFAALFGDSLERVPFLGTGPATVALGEGDEVLAPAAPLQLALPDRATPIRLADGFTAAPSHQFRIEAVVLSRKRYRHDTEAAVSPLDFTLGWGPMSNPAVLSHLRVRQRGRFGYVSAGAEAPVDLGRLSPYWSNVHLVPATPEIAADLDAVGAGQVVQMIGVLADIEGPDGFTWRSSTSRTDRGAGACEILIVREVSVLR